MLRRPPSYLRHEQKENEKELSMLNGATGTQRETNVIKIFTAVIYEFS